MFKSNQNWCASLTMYVDLKNEDRLALACLEKISEFRWLKVAVRRLIFSNVAISKRQKSVQIQSKSVFEFLFDVDLKKENRLAVACLERI